jgi:hypothetical protein
MSPAPVRTNERTRNPLGIDSHCYFLNARIMRLIASLNLGQHVDAGSQAAFMQLSDRDVARSFHRLQAVVPEL